MKTTYNEYKITSVYKGTKNWNFDTKLDNYNNHMIYITNTETQKKCGFEFWNSIAEGEIVTEESLMNAIWCFIQDAISGQMNYDEFTSEFGELDNSKKVHKACQKSYEKYNRVFTEDIYDILEDLENKYGF